MTPVGKFSATPFLLICQPAELKPYTDWDSKKNLSQILTCHASNAISKKSLNILSEMVSRQQKCRRLCLKIVPVAEQRAKITHLKAKSYNCTWMCYFQFLLLIGRAKNTTFCRSTHPVTVCFAGTHILSLHQSSSCMTRTYIVPWRRRAICSFFSTCHSLLAWSHGLPHRNTHLMVNNDSANQQADIGASPSTHTSIWDVLHVCVGLRITHPGIWYFNTS